MGTYHIKTPYPQNFWRKWRSRSSCASARQVRDAHIASGIRRSPALIALTRASTTGTATMLVSAAFDRPLASGLTGSVLSLCNYAASRRKRVLSTLTLVLLALHTVYMLYTIWTSHPQNLFDDLGIPMTAGSDRVARKLKERALVDPAYASPAMEELAAKLSAMSMRERLVLCVSEPTSICE